ncbi:MAG TPA: DUF2065 domain-containing protein [Stellaceae bacterium]|jgi:hypothetical protein|nr:DUF2065 domain-containing protein [Stellaceae bacterium]
MRDLATACALVFVVEGILYSLFPDGMKRMVTQVAVLPASALRLTGLVAAVLGVAAVWFIRG